MANSKKLCFILALFAVALFLPQHFAWAANAAGGMPYDVGVGKFNTSLQGPVAFGMIAIAIVAGVGAYIMQGHMEGLMQSVMRCIIGIAVVSGIVAIIAIAGGTSGAIV